MPITIPRIIRSLKRACLTCVMSVSLFVIQGCTSTPRPEGMPLAQITFAQMDPVLIDAISVEQEVKYNITSPAVSYFHPAPSSIFERYLSQRFKATGSGNGILEISIPEITLQERQVPIEGTTSLWRKYKSILSLGVKFNLLYVYGTNGVKKGSISANRSTILTEDMSITQREQAARNLIEQLILDVDEELVKNATLVTTSLPK